jgi:membrane protease YdiL (CAAX protease family)
MSEPTEPIILPAQPVRHVWCWWLLIALASTMIVTALWDNFERDTPANRVYTMEAMQLRQAMSPAFSGMRPGDVLDKVIEKTKPDASVNPRAAVVTAIAQYEKSKKVSPDIVKAFDKTKPNGKVAIRVYAEKATIKDLKSAIADAGSIGPLGKLMIIHARERLGETGVREQELAGSVGTLLLMTLVVLGALILGIILWIKDYVTRHQQPPPAGFALELPTRGDADRIAMRVVILLSSFVVTSLALAGPALTIILFFGALVAGVALPIFGKSDRLGSVIGRRKPLVNLVFTGVANEFKAAPVIMLAALLVMGIQRFLPSANHPGSDALFSNPSPAVIFAFFLQAVVMAPFIEEVIFRGYLAPAIARVSNPTTGILASGMLFASIHPQGLGGWLPLAAFGSMSAYVAFRTKSLVPSISMHMLHNAVLLLLTLGGT